MAYKTHIQWTESTWNPITGCTVVSPGCTNCYAMKLAGGRLQNHPSRTGLTNPSKAGPVWNGEVRFNAGWLDQPLRWTRPRTVFVCAHGDLFHEDVPDEWIDKVFAVMALAPHHRFQCLTKRADRMRVYMTDDATPFRIAQCMDAMRSRIKVAPEEFRAIDGFPGYFASSHGYIYSDKRGRRHRLSPDAGHQGHQRVQLHRDGGDMRGERRLVHRLILETFVGPTPSPDTQGRHRDGNPANNALDNLRWGDQSENWEDSKRHGRHRRYSKLNSEQAEAIRSRHQDGETTAALAREFGVSDTQIRNIAAGRQWNISPAISWPLDQVWLGVSVEDQPRADERLPHLRNTPAAVRFASVEPLLGPVDMNCLHCDAIKWLDWVIVGGESGPRARPMHPQWARWVRDTCVEYGVPFFMKQMTKKAPIPDDLMVRQFPA